MDAGRDAADGRPLAERAGGLLRRQADDVARPDAGREGGYAIWYTVLPALRATTGATVQLSVPVITALGGVILLGEPVTLRLAVPSIAILYE